MTEKKELNLDNRFGILLKCLRMSRGMSQEDLAKQIDIEVGEVNTLENLQEELDAAGGKWFGHSPFGWWPLAFWQNVFSVFGMPFSEAVELSTEELTFDEVIRQAEYWLRDRTAETEHPLECFQIRRKKREAEIVKLEEAQWEDTEGILPIGTVLGFEDGDLTTLFGVVSDYSRREDGDLCVPILYLTGDKIFKPRTQNLLMAVRRIAFIYTQEGIEKDLTEAQQEWVKEVRQKLSQVEATKIVPGTDETGTIGGEEQAE